MIQASVLMICVCEKFPCLSSKIDCIDKPAYNGIERFILLQKRGHLYILLNQAEKILHSF